MNLSSLLSIQLIHFHTMSVQCCVHKSLEISAEKREILRCVIFLHIANSIRKRPSRVCERNLSCCESPPINVARSSIAVQLTLMKRFCCARGKIRYTTFFSHRQIWLMRSNMRLLETVFSAQSHHHLPREIFLSHFDGPSRILTDDGQQCAIDKVVASVFNVFLLYILLLLLQARLDGWKQSFVCWIVFHFELNSPRLYGKIGWQL